MRRGSRSPGLSLHVSLNAVAFYAHADFVRMSESNHELAPDIFIPYVDKRPAQLLEFGLQLPRCD
ncbi:MAG: hypothetical protein ACYCSS_05170 [Sulfuriferula sp.]